MTAITLNLLAEEQLAEQARARDPVKTALAIGLGLVCLIVIAGTVLRSVASSRRVQMGLMQNHWDSIVAAQKSKSSESFETVKAAADEIYTLNRSRSLSAPQLALIKDIIPESVQLSRLTLQVITELSDPAVSPEAGDADPTGKVKRAPARKATERLSLQLDGRAFISRPEIEVDNFIKKLRDHPVFREQVKSIQLRSIARSDAGNGAAAGAAAGAGIFASFVIECQYKEGGREGQ